jgi:hypothetical protein
LTEGTPINREWVLVTHDGTVIVDWGDDKYMDTLSGKFIDIKENEISHHPTNEELDWLVHINRVVKHDAKSVWFTKLPERPQRTID